MRVPVRRQPETRISEGQQGFARAVAPLDISPLTEVVQGFRDQLLDGQEARQRVDLNRRLIEEVNGLQADFEERRRNPEISPIDFADSTNTAYTERHTAILQELQQQNYSRELIDDFDIRLSSVRQGFYERGLGHQLVQLRARAVEEVEELGVAASQHAAANPDGYETAREMLRDSIRSHPDLTEDERADLEDTQLAVLRDAGARSIAIQNPQLIIDLFDPQGLTAPYQPSVATTTAGGTVTAAAGSWQSVATTVADELGLDPVEVAAVMSYESAGTFSPTRMGGAGNRYMGLIQFGPEERRTYGITTNSTPEEWTTAILSFMRDRGFRRGMSLLDFYSTINAGSPGRYNASDGNGTVRSHAERLLREHRANAEEWLNAGRPAVTPASSVQMVDIPASTSPPNEPAIPQPIIAGNLPLDVQQQVTNDDGTISTVRTISVGTDQGEVLIPTVINGAVVSDEEAIAHYERTGENFGTFETEEAATAYARELSRQHGEDITTIRTGNALLDDLTGSERLQLLGRAREQQNRNLATRKAEMDVRIGNITAEALNNGGEIAAPIPTEQEVLQVYGPIEGPQRWAQVQQSQATGRAITTFRTQSAESIQRSLEALAPDPGSPTYQTELQIYQAAERAAQTLIAERDRDPAAYALKYFPSVREAAERGTADYYAELDRVYETLGIDADHAPVMSAEATERLTEEYRTMSPSQRREFMRQNFSTMGEDRFRRFVADMEGTTAEGDARIFALLRTYPGRNGEIGGVYHQILEGREIILRDPAKRPNPERIRERFRAEGLSAINNLNTDASVAIQEAAEALYAVNGGDPVNIDPVLYRRALEVALGGSLPADMRRGEVTDYTILPPRINRQQFEGWIEQQTLVSLTNASVERRPPRAGDLRTSIPVEDIIDEGVFVMVSPGRYMIKMASDGRPVMTSTGRPFLVNVNPHEVARARPVARPARRYGDLR